MTVFRIWIATLTLVAASNADAQRMDPSVRRDYTTCAAENSSPDTAIAACWRAINSGQLSQEDVAESHNNLGYELARKGELQQAVEQFDRAIEITPDYARAFMNRALSYFRLRELDLAMVDAETTLTLSKEEFGAYATRARILVAMGMPNEALADATLVINRAPRAAEGYLARGDALRALGKEKEALTDYQNAQRRLMDEYVKVEVERAIASLKPAETGKGEIPAVARPKSPW